MVLTASSPVVNLGRISELFVYAISGSISIITGNLNTNGVICSYTPASGRHFMLLSYSVGVNIQSSISSNSVLVRNSGTMTDTILVNAGYLDRDTASGDSLLGDGIKTYDMYIQDTTLVNVIQATFKAVII